MLTSRRRTRLPADNAAWRRGIAWLSPALLLTATILDMLAGDAISAGIFGACFGVFLMQAVNRG